MEIETGTWTLPRGEKLDWAAATDIGLKRAENQDSFLAAPPSFLVADGMGGHAGGKQASSTLIDKLRVMAGREMNLRSLRKYLEAACEDVMALVDRNIDYTISPPGTTLTGMVILGSIVPPVASVEAGSVGGGAPGDAEPVEAQPGDTVRGAAGPDEADETPAQDPQAGASDEFLLLNVGDSRTYVLRDGLLSRLTRDHSQVAEMVEAGMLTPEEARVWPNRSVITRAIGAGQVDLPQIDTWTYPLAGLRRYLVCSDGLHSMIDDGQIGRALGSAETPREAVDALINQALQAGGTDNVTAIVLDVTVPPPPPPQESE